MSHLHYAVGRLFTVWLVLPAEVVPTPWKLPLISLGIIYWSSFIGEPYRQVSNNTKTNISVISVIKSKLLITCATCFKTRHIATSSELPLVP